MSKIKIIAGCRRLNLTKGMVGKIISITPMGAEYSHQSKVLIRFLNRDMVLWVSHVNRMNDDDFNMTGHMGLAKIRAKLVPDETPIPGTVKLKGNTSSNG